MSDHAQRDYSGEKSKSRLLWEEVFAEDSQKFLDYYDRCMADHNKIYLDEQDGEAISMLHRNPYRVHVGESAADVSYIVAVATKKAYRHQGRMRRLLQKALQDSYLDGEPFVYLMPASERIYLPFGFRTVSYQDVLTMGGVFCAGLQQGRMEQSAGDKSVRGEVRAAEYQRETEPLRCLPADYGQLEEISGFSEALLARRCAVYAKRDLAYFRRMWKEQEAVNGGILLFYRGEELAGYCFSGVEDGAEVWELAVEPGSLEDYAQALQAVTEYFKELLPLKISAFLPGVQISGVDRREFSYRPITMVRLTNLPALARNLRAAENTEVIFRLRDGFLAQNNGLFLLRVGPDGGTLEQLEDAHKMDGNDGDMRARASIGSEAGECQRAVDLTVEELTDVLFGIREKAGFPSQKLRLLRPVFLNELV